MFAKVLEFLAAGMASQGITVSCNEQAEVYAEDYVGEYHQVLINILNNAREALHSHGTPDPRICVSICALDGRSVVTIQDNGGGIAADILPQIFDPYFTTKFKSQGTGLGLFMAKPLIENHMQGHLSARTIDHGAEFRIEV